jgi:hypothetical protein
MYRIKFAQISQKLKILHTHIFDLYEIKTYRFVEKAYLVKVKPCQRYTILCANISNIRKTFCYLLLFIIYLVSWGKKTVIWDM